jgi:type II secretory pathway component PulF
LKKTPMEKELLEVKSKVALGMNLGEAVRKYTTVDAQLSHMVEIGEKASNLPEQLRLLRDLYEEETNQQIELFTGLVGLFSKVGTVAIIAGIYLATSADYHGRYEDDEFGYVSRLLVGRSFP